MKQQPLTGNAAAGSSPARGADITVVARTDSDEASVSRARIPGDPRDHPSRTPAGLEPRVLPQRKLRHRRLGLSLLLMVILPALAAGAYLYLVAADQYASRTAFSVRKEEARSAIELFGGMADIPGSSTADTDIVYDFIQSQELVESIDRQLDLEAIFSKPEWDPVFAYDPSGTIEDLLEHWRGMIKVYYDSGTGLISIRVHAFDPADARAIAQAIVDESSRMINDLSAIAREDATRHSRHELEQAIERLKDAREAMTEFRSRSQIVDPTAELQGRMEVMNGLQGELAAALVELELLQAETRVDDARHATRQEVVAAEIRRRIGVIENRIAQERQKFGIGGTGPDGQSYATLVAEFERLALDREFAEQSYLAAFSAYNNALAEAQRQSRYVAAHVRPTLAQRAEYPEREVLLGATTMFLFMGWSVLVLVFYSFRERR